MLCRSWALLAVRCRCCFWLWSTAAACRRHGKTDGHSAVDRPEEDQHFKRRGIPQHHELPKHNPRSTQHSASTRCRWLRVGHILPGPHRCTQVAWEHEQFSRKRILAATLSSRPSSAHVSSGLFDARSRVSTPILRRNIGLVIELLAKHIYGHRQLALKYVGRIRPLLCRKQSTVAEFFPAMRTASVCG